MINYIENILLTTFTRMKVQIILNLQRKNREISYNEDTNKSEGPEGSLKPSRIATGWSMTGSHSQELNVLINSTLVNPTLIFD